MSSIRAIRWLIGLGVLSCFAVSCVRDGLTGSANGNSKENIRHAKDIINMWDGGFDPARKPNLMPSQARRMLDEVVASRAEASFKDEAKELLARLDAKPHYYALAERSAAFLPKVADYAAIDDRELTEPVDAADSLPSLTPGRKVVVLMMSRPNFHPEEENSSPFFDADLIEACGDRVALAPEEVGAVVSISWRRSIIGRYQQTGFTLPNGREIKFLDRKTQTPQPIDAGDAYRQVCVVIVREFPGGRTVAIKLLGADDPAKKRFGRGVERNPTGEEEVRRQLTDYLRSLIAGAK